MQWLAGQVFWWIAESDCIRGLTAMALELDWLSTIFNINSCWNRIIWRGLDGCHWLGVQRCATVRENQRYSWVRRAWAVNAGWQRPRWLIWVWEVSEEWKWLTPRLSADQFKRKSTWVNLPPLPSWVGPNWSPTTPGYWLDNSLPPADELVRPACLWTYVATWQQPCCSACHWGHSAIWLWKLNHDSRNHQESPDIWDKVLQADARDLLERPEV